MTGWPGNILINKIMSKKEELKMWWNLYCKLAEIPSRHRSKNFTEFFREVDHSILELVEDLNLDIRNWTLQK